MAKRIKPISFSKSVKYDPKVSDYTLQMRKKRSWWWLLLLLLPLFLLIECKRDVTVYCYEGPSGDPLPDTEVTINYDAHYLLKKAQNVECTDTTDADGLVTFHDLPCSVFSYIFHCTQTARYDAVNGCYMANGVEKNFHYTSRVELALEPARNDLFVKVLDAETGDILPGATVIYKYYELKEEHTDSVHTDEAGVATLPAMRLCSAIDELTGHLYGYADTTHVNVPAKTLLTPNDTTALRLRPIKDRFIFFVKDKETRQPIAGAQCTVVLTTPSGKSTKPRQLTTSVDGKGLAAYDDAFILATIAIKATKTHYADGELEGGPWTVDKFKTQSEDTRTIWLEPLPFKVDFQNVDSINGRGIPGVKNQITVTDPAGKTMKFTETSNRNGIFGVAAKEGSKVEIASTCDPGYWPKNTTIKSFAKGEKIPMKPVCEMVVFRTVSKGQPLADVSVTVNGSISGNLPVTSQRSGFSNPDGTFGVAARILENLSVVATKTGYKTNNTTVRNTPVSQLKGIVDIPLDRNDPKVFNYDSPAQYDHNNVYDFGSAPVKFNFTWKFCEYCTYIVVSDANGNELKRVGTDDSTNTIFSPSSGSCVITSPTAKVKVWVHNSNGHDCRYTLTEII